MSICTGADNVVAVDGVVYVLCSLPLFNENGFFTKQMLKAFHKGIICKAYESE